MANETMRDVRNYFNAYGTNAREAKLLDKTNGLQLCIPATLANVWFKAAWDAGTKPHHYKVTAPLSLDGKQSFVQGLWPITVMRVEGDIATLSVSFDAYSSRPASAQGKPPNVDDVKLQVDRDGCIGCLAFVLALAAIIVALVALNVANGGM